MKKTIALTLTSVLFPLTLLASVLTSLYYKSTNPDNVDISQGLAYLSKSMTVAIVVFIVILIVAVNARIGKVQDQYLIDNGRPTLQQFFDNLKSLKK